jgi:hypothetical protein
MESSSNGKLQGWNEAALLVPKFAKRASEFRYQARHRVVASVDPQSEPYGQILPWSSGFSPQLTTDRYLHLNDLTYS